MTVSIDYTSRDFNSIRQSLLEYAERVFPEWRPGSEGDFGVLLTEMLAWVGDVNSYYVDRAQLEAYLPTASQPESIFHIAALLGYVPHSGNPAKGQVILKNSDTVREIVVPGGTRLTSEFDPDLDAEMVFETDYPVVLQPLSEFTVDITEGETKEDPETGRPLTLAVADGTSSQKHRLPHPLVYRDTVEVWVAGEQWREVTHLLDADPREAAFSTRIDPQGFTWIEFGDDLNGRVPAVGLEIATRYRVGYGSRGNIPAARVVGVYQSTTAGLSVNYEQNSGEMLGGADPESMEEVRTNAPMVFRTRDRAVTLEDFRNLALAVPGVTHASAVAQFWSSITIYITGPEGAPPSATLLRDVRKHLEGRALAGVTVTVAGPAPVSVNIGLAGTPLAVEVWPQSTNTQVRYDVEQAIKASLSPASTDFGQRLTVSWLYKVIMDTPGVRFVRIESMSRADASPGNTADIVLQPWEFPRLGDLFVTTAGGLG